MWDIILTIIFSIMVAIGVFMVFVPFLPALFYMLIISAVFALIGGFKVITLGNLAVLAVIFVLSFLTDTLSGVLGAKWSGASKKSILWGILGLIAGFVMAPPFGGIVGLFGGIFFAELMAGKSRSQAVKHATGGLIGSMIGVIINFVLALTFLTLFVIFIFS